MNPMNTWCNKADGFGLTILQRVLCVVALSALSACATRLDNAPVVDRSVSQPGAPGVLAGGAPAPAPVPLGPPPPGYYRVKPGDTLYRIALNYGQNYRDIAAWNNLSDPNQIEVDQLLRVVPPGTTPTAAGPGVSTAPVAGIGIQSAPLAPPPASSTSTPLAGSVAGASPAQAVPPASAAAADTLDMVWPAHGAILQTFDDAKNKGIDIGGTLGDPVVAAADGRVVYAGSGLRGYGNLIIVKHNATFLTAYAHNQSLLVKEGDAVVRGQKIATMGSSDADHVMLHFEVRKQGKPVDPMKYLPAH
jgi:lipoprotein NlpD